MLFVIIYCFFFFFFYLFFFIIIIIFFFFGVRARSAALCVLLTLPLIRRLVSGSVLSSPITRFIDLVVGIIIIFVL